MIVFTCPRCGDPLIDVAAAQKRCERDGLEFARIDGIWRFLLQDKLVELDAFMRDYERIRLAEGRGSDDPAYYRRLPFAGPSAGAGGSPIEGAASLEEMWRLRAASYETFAHRVLAPLMGPPVAALDLGAGNGWLSNRMAEAGHEVHAVDILDNDLDGLGATRHYRTSFTPVQASFDQLPYGDKVFDLIVFNASFHYSVDYARTLEHVLAKLVPGGVIAVLDTPVYRKRESGLRMVEEREARFLQRYGTPSRALPMQNFLTWEQLGALAAGLGLDYRLDLPWYGFRRLAAVFLTRLLGRRQPAVFPLILFSESVKRGMGG